MGLRAWSSRRRRRPVDRRRRQGSPRCRPSNGRRSPPRRHFGPRDRGAERRKRIGAELAGAERQIVRRVRAVGADVKRQAVEPAALRKSAIGSVRSRADSQPWTRTTAGPGCATAGRDEPGRQVEPIRRRHDGLSNGEPEVGGRDVRDVPARISRSHAIGQRESIRQPDAQRRWRQQAGPADGPTPRGRQAWSGCQVPTLGSGRSCRADVTGRPVPHSCPWLAA